MMTGMMMMHDNEVPGDDGMVPAESAGSAGGEPQAGGSAGGEPQAPGEHDESRGEQAEQKQAGRRGYQYCMYTMRNEGWTKECLMYEILEGVLDYRKKLHNIKPDFRFAELQTALASTFENLAWNPTDCIYDADTEHIKQVKEKVIPDSVSVPVEPVPVPEPSV